MSATELSDIARIAEIYFFLFYVCHVLSSHYEIFVNVK